MAQRRHGFQIVHPDDPVEAFESGFDWHGWACENNAATPADQACFKLDLETWLASLAPRRRQIAELLAAGTSTNEAAAAMKVTPSAISQVRNTLERSWKRFQGLDTPTPV